jgi:hypothetical protein
VLLILLGLWFLVTQFVPGLQGWFSWPLVIVGVGVLLLVLGLVTGEPGMLVPACIVGGIGGLLYWQWTTDNWASWSWSWSLIPGFVGVGTVLYGLVSGKRDQVRGGAWLVFISLVMFAIAGSFFGALGFLGQYWPVLVILLGLVVLVRAFIRRR